MSYDIGLYQKAFLKNAIENDLGDWTKADPIDSTVRDSIKDMLLSDGYIVDSESGVSTDLVHPKKEWGLQVCIFKGQISFSIPYWDDADNPVEETKRYAWKIAKKFNLGYHDRQEGTTEY